MLFLALRYQRTRQNITSKQYQYIYIKLSFKCENQTFYFYYGSLDLYVNKKKERAAQLNNLIYPMECTEEIKRKSFMKVQGLQV